jgi:hypothetical protein
VDEVFVIVLVVDNSILLQVTTVEEKNYFPFQGRGPYYGDVARLKMMDKYHGSWVSNQSLY